ncbi:MAG: OsmC family protein, partial [Promethearchaeota archaeon]
MINRINVDVFKETVENVKKDPSTSIKKLEIEGTWRLDEQTGPQFETKLKTEKAGEILVQSDETIILGGGGTAPNPVQYCIGGLLACYSATFVKWATMEGILLKSFKIRGTASM